ncbi:hypothetical protein ERICI_04105 [Paenibacillus larvae subsp. larvae]|uniref:Uncharacterized protein n=2 Tax=Paenibacillus larvae subsp. larvae TaxID=147375 RepID=V9W2G9_9BACL|nr:hypothetical protein ERIC2_c04360 [Paenibacillus larvae subsp. larvae DSM 25430]AVF23829.1 hypothetical protein ERICI_04105 [Paenibacillus larvae subsp. larvae]AVG10897.1 hypothetical protein ERICII_00448 [Paenibacillus larvae subsp. larvae DSM 25430]ETK29503.1 hypothetical protein ERIC1_1c30550 [Paenibacillus larvae subsp. larvae DSM 25719]QHZ49672.1 hypothetical protein ERICV_00476 [Paenibacillus larvae subsp. larvae]
MFLLQIEDKLPRNTIAAGVLYVFYPYFKYKIELYSQLLKRLLLNL